MEALALTSPAAPTTMRNSGRRSQNVKPSWRDDRGSERGVAGINEMNTHVVVIENATQSTNSPDGLTPTTASGFVLRGEFAMF
jgi:hypothetical protein